MDESGSIGSSDWAKIQWVLWYFRWWIAQWHPYCKQYITAYTFNTRATLPPSHYYEYVTPNHFNPSTISRNGGGSDFGQPLIRGLEFILLHRDINTCFIFISDGYANYPKIETELYSYVKNWMNSRGYWTCALCYHIKNHDSDPVPISFQRTCDSIGGTHYSFRTHNFQREIASSLKAKSASAFSRISKFSNN